MEFPSDPVQALEDLPLANQTRLELPLSWKIQKGEAHQNCEHTLSGEHEHDDSQHEEEDRDEILQELPCQAERGRLKGAHDGSGLAK